MFSWLLTHSPLLYFTQSIWRDEAFSILAAERPFPTFLQNITLEPPLYYIFLHFWMKLFGSSEIAARSLSLLGFGLATVIIIIWAEKLFKKHWLSWFLPLFFFFNPMLLYYAFEVRAYGWYIFFATLSIFSYMEKHWKLLGAATILGFYTHSYFLVVPFVQTVHWLLTNRQKQFFRNMTIAGLIMLPWFYHIFQQAKSLKGGWYFPVDMNLITSVLGNMFLGYEGTPWFLWPFTKLLSIILLMTFLFALRKQDLRSRSLFFFSMVMLPLALLIGVSFIKPLFVNRYLIPVTIAEVLLIGFSIESIKHRTIQKIMAFCLLLFAFLFNFWYPDKHAKLDVRSAIREINAIRAKDDLYLPASPLIFFETIYYASDSSKVFLYNPQGVTFPWYVGSTIVSPSQMIRELPVYPTRAFLIQENGTYNLVFRST